ncbi:TPA: type II toxin-antitoxin system PemK/MazF family toxin [Candidatus Micrarchaeota archaeon]|nr:type II toxin-antitoxin system PemK/MazF family toxin [Candidatus Micrarchaeota archaeon]
MARILRGDVRWAELNPVRGHEQSGRRPVLVSLTMRTSTVAGSRRGSKRMMAWRTWASMRTWQLPGMCPALKSVISDPSRLNLWP